MYGCSAKLFVLVGTYLRGWIRKAPQAELVALAAVRGIFMDIRTLARLQSPNHGANSNTATIRVLRSDLERELKLLKGQVTDNDLNLYSSFLNRLSHEFYK